MSLPALRDLQRLILRINAGSDLAVTLQAVVDGVVEGLGFDVAVVNLVEAVDRVQVVAVAGSEDAAAALMGATSSLADWQRELDSAAAWGGLRFVPHDADSVNDSLPTWIPDLAVPDDPGAWHPLDSLFAPLVSAAGELIGVLSVDLPSDGRRPDRLQCELLEMFAVQAAIAIDNARLTEALRNEQQRLQASERAFRLAFEAAPVGMSVIDMRHQPGRFLRVNAAMSRMLGYSRHELLEMSFADVTHPDNREADVTAMQRAIGGRQDSYRTEQRYVRRDGTPVWLSISTSVVREGDGSPLFGITQFEDISDRREAHLELTRRARLDPLTGLLNRAALLERVDESVARAQDTGAAGALLFCDLDDFKPINDTYGHAVGDQVLAIVARRLDSQIRTGDTAGRFGGDEFVVVADALSGDDLDDLVTRLRDAVAAPLDVAGISVSITMTIGHVSIDPVRVESPAELLETADAEMYRLKR